MSFMSTIQYEQHRIPANCASGKVMVYHSSQNNGATIQIEETTDSRAARLCLSSGKVMVYSTRARAAALEDNGSCYLRYFEGELVTEPKVATMTRQR
jgi:hypothetical protein